MKSLPILAAALLTTCNAQQADPAPTKAEIGKPVVIDGIEITLSAVRIGGESETAPKAGSLPVAQFLKVSATLKNVSDVKIITIQDPWQKTRLKDVHGNFYKVEDVERGRVLTKLRPGKETSTVIYFEVPLENSPTMEMICDPCFYRDNGDRTLTDLSRDSFTLEFPNPAAKAASP